MVDGVVSSAPGNKATMTLICQDNSISLNYAYKGAQCIIYRRINLPIIKDYIFNFWAGLKAALGDYDVVHAGTALYGAGYSFLGRMFKNNAKFIVTYHGTYYVAFSSTTPKRFVHKILHEIARFSLSFLEKKSKICDVATAVSKRVKRELEVYYGLDPRKIVVIYNGVDIDRFKPRDIKECRMKLGLRKDGVYGLFIGGDPKRKGLDIAVEAIKILADRWQNLRLLVVGTKDSESQNGRIIHLGKVSSDRLPLVYSAADFLIFPSRYEGFGLVVLEAIASGLPVIVSNKTPAAEVIKNWEEGVIINGFNPENYAEAIWTLLQKKDISEKIKKNARKKAEKYSWSIQGKKYWELYEKLASNSNSGSSKRKT